MRSRRAQLRDVRRASADLIKERRRKLNARLMCNRREMQNGIGRAANAHIYGNRILECLARHNITRTDIFLNEFDNDRTCMLGEQATLPRIGGGNRTVAGKSHTEHLGQGVHRICREQTGAGAAAGAGVLLNSSHFTRVHFSRREHACRLERLTDTDIAPAMAPCKHGAAADENRWNVKPRSSHEHARYNLVAVRNEDEPIKSRRHRDGLDGVRNQFAAREGVFHPRVPHGNAVADPDGREFNRRSASCCYTKLYSFCDRIQVKVPRNNLVERIADTNQRLSEILGAISVCMKKRAMCTACRSLFYDITSHKNSPNSTIIYGGYALP